MAHLLTAEFMLQGPTLSSIGAYACLSGGSLDAEAMPVRREPAKAGRPGIRW